MNADSEATTDVVVLSGPSDLPVRTQFLIFTLFGDYVTHLGGKIWTGNLLQLMELLGVSERAARSTLSRMTRKGWIRSQKFGRRSQYSLTEKGEALLKAGRTRIFEPVSTNWDGQWHLVVYSLPEKRRRTRHALRTQLSWLGFGPLAPGTWVSPHDRPKELKALLNDLNVKGYVDEFCGPYLGPSSARDLAWRCWDLDGLGAQYQEFINKFQSAYLDCKVPSEQNSTLSPEQCFLRRFWLMHEYQSFPLKDPNLPPELLPPDWVGYAARQLFDDYRKLLGAHAIKFVKRHIQANGLAPSA